MKKTLYSKKKYLFFGLVKRLAVIFLVPIIFISFLFLIIRISPKSNKSLNDYAGQISAKCFKSSYRPKCYDDEIPILMKEISMNQAFEVTKIVQKNDDSYWFCHGMAHKLSAKEYDKDPAKWKDVMNRCPVGMCSNGCLHGALSRHFSSDSVNDKQLKELLPDLLSLCEPRDNWKPTNQEQSSCYHELGHLSLYLTDANLNKSAEICNTIAVKSDGRNYLQTCHEGMFMQVFEPRELEDFALIYHIVPAKEKLASCDIYPAGVEKGGCWKRGWKNKEVAFCNQYKEDLRNACFREAWVINDDQIETPEGIMNYCNYTNKSEEKRKCYNKLYYSLMAKYDFDTNRMLAICKKMPKNLMPQCFANTASRLIETDHSLFARSAEICTLAKKFAVEKECYEEIIHYLNFVLHPDSEKSLKLCQSLPQPWNSKCSL